MNNEQQQEAIELLGEAYDLIQFVKPLLISESGTCDEVVIGNLLNRINELLYSTI
tara:strand:+ start:901 stop:1065 length:165 start_codon:yes stop_codon:yes gene_type:complete